MPHNPLQVRLLKPKLFMLISTGFTDALFSHSPPSTVSAPDISIREMHNIFQLLQRIVMTVGNMRHVQFDILKSFVHYWSTKQIKTVPILANIETAKPISTALRIQTIVAGRVSRSRLSLDFRMVALVFGRQRNTMIHVTEMARYTTYVPGTESLLEWGLYAWWVL